MKIYNINGLQPAKDYFDLSKKKSSAAAEKKGDRVEISPSARNHASLQPLKTIVQEYLDKIQPLRQERVESAIQSIRDGYSLDREKMALIADKIMQNFNITD